MLRILRQGKVLSMLIVCLCLSGISQLAQAEDDNLNIVFTTTNAGGSYGNKHVHVVWITDSSGNWVYTAGTNDGNKRALWAKTRASSLKRWSVPNPARSADVDARTGATQTTYKTYDINWNWRRIDGTEVPDGNYRVNLECTNSDSGNPSNYTYFNITKGNSPQSIGPVSQGGYNNVKLTFTPGVSASPPVVNNLDVRNVNSSTVIIYVQLVSTGGENPDLSIYWGDNNGGTNPGAWDHVENIGIKSPGVYYKLITGLTPETTYYYRCFGENSGGGSWAESSESFVIPNPNPGDITLNPVKLDFFETAIGSDKDMSFDIENTGGSALTISSLAIVGLESDVYSLVSHPAVPFDVAASSSQAITVRFAPMSPQSYNYAQLAVASNDQDTPIALLGLNGKGSFEPEILIPAAASVGGVCNGLAVEGSNVLLAQGASLTVIDTSDAANPSKLDSVYVGDMIENISANGNVAYAAAGNQGFAVIGLSNAVRPELMTVYDTAGYAYDIACDGDILCIADGDQGLDVYDISSADAPVYQGTYATQGSARSVCLAGTTAYVLDEQLGLQIVNASTRTLIGSLDEIEFGNAISIVGTKAYITDRLGDLFIVNIATPSAPSLLSQTALQGGMGSAVAINGNYAYVACESGVEIVNISNASAPVSMGIYQSGSASDIISTSAAVYVAQRDNGLSILDISNAMSPAEVGSYELQTAPTATESDSSLVYVSDDIKGLQIMDMSSQGKGQSLGAIDTLGQAQSVVVSGTTAYIANGLSGLQIVDVSNSQVPALLGNFPTSGFATAVAVSGNTVIVADSNCAYILDVTNTSSPSLVGKWESDGWIHDVAINGSYGYVANGGYGLEIIELSNAAWLGEFDTPGNAYGVAVSGNTAYVADGARGLQIIDVTSPSSPALLGAFDTPGMAMDVKVVGERVCLADGCGGVLVIDVSSPSQPGLYAKSDIPLRSISTTVSDSRIVSGDRTAGLVVLNTQIKPTQMEADINTDSSINLLDLKLLADNWLEREAMLNAMASDINNDDIVNYLDFSILARNWLFTGN